MHFSAKITNSIFQNFKLIGETKNYSCIPNNHVLLSLDSKWKNLHKYDRVHSAEVLKKIGPQELRKKCE